MLGEHIFKQRQKDNEVVFVEYHHEERYHFPLISIVFHFCAIIEVDGNIVKRLEFFYYLFAYYSNQKHFPYFQSKNRRRHNRRRCRKRRSRKCRPPPNHWKAPPRRARCWMCSRQRRNEFSKKKIKKRKMRNCGAARKRMMWNWLIIWREKMQPTERKFVWKKDFLLQNALFVVSGPWRLKNVQITFFAMTKKSILIDD